jgi:hypothetical protein
MSTDIIVAIIGAVAVIVAAIITKKNKKRREESRQQNTTIIKKNEKRSENSNQQNTTISDNNNSVFLSHNYKDKKFVRRLAEDLQKYGIKVWVDEAEIMVGDSLISKIGDGIESMDYLGVVLSPNSIDSPWVKKELEIAINKEINGKKVRVLPILYKKCTLPTFLEGKLWADFTVKSKYDSGLQDLLKRLAPQHSKQSALISKDNNLQEAKRICEEAILLHLERLNLKNISRSQAKVEILQVSPETINFWKENMRIDTLIRTSKSSFVEGPSRNPLPKGYIANWLMSLQSIEDDLAEIGKIKESGIEIFNSISEKTIHDIWSPSQQLIEKTSVITAPILYWLTRFTIAEKRRNELRKDRISPFEPLISLYEEGIFFLGLDERNVFVFYVPDESDDFNWENRTYLTPILINQVIPLNTDLHENIGYETEVSSARIKNRISNLRGQLLTIQVALLRHFGYWFYVHFPPMHEFLHTAFDPFRFVSLLEVGSHCLLQLNILNDKPQFQSNWLPTFDISAKFDSSSSIWGHVKPLIIGHYSNEINDSRCIDPILDIQIINYSRDPCIVNEVIVRNYGFWSEVKAMPMYGVLESAHTYNIEVDFKEETTVTQIDPPFFIAPQSPGRFKIRLLNFKKKCRGNFLLIQIGFKAGDEVCDTPIYMMDI